MKRLQLFRWAAILVVVASGRAALAEVTATSGASYASLCQSRGVPLPPRWGETDPNRPRWTFRDTLPGTSVFIVRNVDAKVYYYANAQGVCMALPRYNPGNSTALFFGVICQGTTGKVCFWDPDESKPAIPVNPTSPMVITSTNAGDLTNARWLGGAALLAQTNTGGMCTDCHRGENPFIVVPGAATDLRPVGVSQFPSGWYDPIVGSGWLSNAGPGSVPSASDPPLGSDDGTCLQCHAGGGGALGGRFPALGLINGSSSGYCTEVLEKARMMNVMPPFVPAPNVTFDKHWNAIAAACLLPGPPVAVTPTLSRRHAINPAFLTASQFPQW